ncbi:MAG: DUF523 domain-containing protein [Erysipelotrichaceae bacterium]|nr:DUF523 domain-containing protein [Erysipelotrichaceae bacterium]
MIIGVSSCLLGENCKYNGGNNRSEKVCALAKDHTLIGVCPEMLGGLPCPRTPCEIVGDQVISKTGQNCTKAYEGGAQKALKILKDQKAEMVILQPRSPSCGAKKIYDGSFSGTLIEGQGTFAKLLKENSIPVVEADSLSVVID